MATVEFEVQLGQTGGEWTRVRFTTTAGKVVTFLVQYETTLGGRPAPVVRFDNARGFPHQDVLNRRGEVIEKRRLPINMSSGEALNLAMRDIQENWQRYRSEFSED